MTVSREEAATTIQNFYKAWRERTWVVVVGRGGLWTGRGRRRGSVCMYIIEREREMDAYYDEMDRIAEMDAYYEDYEEKCTRMRDDERGYTKADALFHRLSRASEAPLVKAARD
jgi:hypothetical protein